MTENRTNGAAKDFAGAILSPYRASASIAAIVRERNANYYRTLLEDAREMLRGPTPGTYDRNVRSLSNERIQQREAFGTTANEATSAYLDLLYAPFYYLRER